MKARSLLSLLLATATATAGAATVGLPTAGAATPAATSPAAALAALPAEENPIVDDVRVGRHATYDRVVIELRGRVASHRVRRAAAIYADGSGDKVAMRGASFLEVSLRPAQAHDRHGVSTTRRELTPNFPALRHVKVVGDYEGVVTLGIGLSDRVDYKVSTLSSPHRLVIDVRHPLPAPTSTATRVLPPVATAPARLVDVRTARHGRFDRVVFQFDGKAPGVRAEYVRRLEQEGTGTVLPLEGKAVLRLTLDKSSGHDDRFKPTWPYRPVINPRLPALRQVRLAGDFEAQLTFGLGIDEKAGFRVLRLADPTRVVVDVAH